MFKVKLDDRLYFQSNLLKENNLNHCFTSRCGGVSCGRIEGLNLGFRVNDETTSVIQNYHLVAQDMGWDFNRITAGRQTHSANIRVITDADAGKGVSRESEFEDVDGLITNVKDLPLVVYYADCVPVLMADTEAGVIAAVHSGWRGTVAEITANAIRMMCEQYGAETENIKAVIGPSIGPCCFETGSEVACEFDKRLVECCSDDKFKVDLWTANKEILLKCGLKEDNIEVMELCTICNSDILYSYRAHKEKTGRMGAFISLK